MHPAGPGCGPGPGLRPASRARPPAHCARRADAVAVQGWQGHRPRECRPRSRWPADGSAHTAGRGSGAGDGVVGCRLHDAATGGRTGPARATAGGRGVHCQPARWPCAICRRGQRPGSDRSACLSPAPRAALQPGWSRRGPGNRWPSPPGSGADQPGNPAWPAHWRRRTTSR